MASTQGRILNFEKLSGLSGKVLMMGLLANVILVSRGADPPLHGSEE